MSKVLVCSAITLASVLALAQGGPPGGGQRQGGRTTPTTPEPQATQAQPPNTSSIIAPSTTKKTINLPSGQLSYTAHAAQLPLKSDSGEVECRMFYVYYSKDGANTDQRPVTFCFNGGPGSATFWLHLGTLGPKMPPMPDDGSLPKPPYHAMDNPDTWLDFTDVVAIDAPGTGYSRLARPDLASRYFGVRPDIAAFTEFIRAWLSEHQRWRSPLFIAGESYGGIRGSGLSYSLWRAGITVSGFVSISGTSNYITLDGMRGNLATYIGFVPTMAATAWYHKKLNPRFKTVEQVVKECTDWVNTEYATALLLGDSLSAADKDRIAGKLAGYIGLPKKDCLGANLKVSAGPFFRELLRDEGKQIGRLDSRITSIEETAVGAGGGGGLGDPSMEAITAPYYAVINDYLARDLQVKTDMRYLSSGNVQPWTEPEGSYAETSTDLRNLISRNPYFRVLYACGYYDLACPFNASLYTVNQMGLNEDQRKRISFTYYPAGHMMYSEKASRKKFHDDVKQFFAECLTK